MGLDSRDPVAERRAVLAQQIAPYAFLAPAAVILGVFLVLPVAMAFYLSFTKYNALTPAVWTGLANYQRLVSEPLFWKALWNSVLFLVGVVPALVILPLFLAVLVNTKLPGISFFRAAYYLPVVISMVVAGLMWKWIFAENGASIETVQQSSGGAAAAEDASPTATLVIGTHAALEASLAATVEALRASTAVASIAHVLRIEGA